MLVEIQCNKFLSYNEIRKPIRFHSGLNTILGGQGGNNSIGKSTFLLIIDYVYGGNTYKDSDAAHEVGNHVINFAFEFNNKIHYFSRDIVHHNIVNICDNNYNIISEPLSIDEFRNFLFKSYNIDLQSVSFRDIISRYFRIYGKENYYETKPLDSHRKEKGEKTITDLEKLFNVYSKIEEYKVAKSQKYEEKNAFNNARKHDFISSVVTTKKQYNENGKKIDELETKLLEIMDNQDKELSDIDLSNAEEVAKLKGEVTVLKRKRSISLSQLNSMQINMNSGMPPNKADLDDLHEFFPNAHIRKIEEIEMFHFSLQELLKEEVVQEINRLNILIETINSKIFELEEKMRKLGIPSKLSKSFLHKYSDLERNISDLKGQNKAYIDFTALKTAASVANKALKNVEESQLKLIESDINEQMVNYNNFIYEGKQKSPVLDINSSKSYTFKTPNDTGTGTSYKSLIVFDLSILKLTPLPALAHDSLIFKNIGDAPIDKIMELYMKSEKQIFIAFDKENSYSQKTRKILSDTTVLSLNEGGDELFGRSWNKIN